MKYSHVRYIEKYDRFSTTMAILFTRLNDPYKDTPYWHGAIRYPYKIVVRMTYDTYS